MGNNISLTIICYESYTLSAVCRNIYDSLGLFYSISIFDIIVFNTDGRAYG